MKKDSIFSNINSLKGVGPQLTKYLKKKKIEKVKDILLNFPYSETDRSKISKLNELEIGKIHTIKVMVKRLNFPRIFVVVPPSAVITFTSDIGLLVNESIIIPSILTIPAKTISYNKII